jgi:hypothetical protein
MGETVIQRSFAGGELAPALHARADQVKYVTGLRTCRNFLVERQGGVSNRAGFRYVASCKTASAAVLLLRYVSEVAGESVLIEAGAGYFRFYKQGAPVTVVGVLAWNGATNYVQGDLASSGGVNYYAIAASVGVAPPNAAKWYAMPAGNLLEIPHPFTTNDLFHWEQSGRVITLTHTTTRPQELHYLALTRWVLLPVTTAPWSTPPVGLAGVAGAVGTLDYRYKVTAAQIDSYEETTESAQVQILNCATPTPAAPNALTWTPLVGAVEYYVYCDPFTNGTFGFIGTATGVAAFKDAGFAPNFQLTPPLARVLFATAGNYPNRCAHYQQRRFFANTVNDPDAIWGSRTGFPSNFTISSPLQDDDALTFRIIGNQYNPVRHLLGLKSLIVLTDAGEWTVGLPKTPLTPSDIPADQETYVGVGEITPVVVGNSILYVQARGSVVRDLRFDQTVEGLGGRDLTLFAAHLFDGKSIRAIDYAQTPHSIIWAVRSDGVLLGLTYVREEEVYGWHRHDTGAGGFFWDVCTVPEPLEDAVYVIVRRTIGGNFVRYIERLAPRTILDFDAECFFVDAGLSYSGVAVSNVAGLGHLEGQVVAVVGDGQVLYDGNPIGADAAAFTVTGGTLPVPLVGLYTHLHVGLPIRYAEIELLDLDVQGSNLRDKKKRIGSVSLLLDKSSRTFWAGPDANHLLQEQLEPWQAHEDQASGQVELAMTADYNNYGRVFIRQTDPLPITILGVLPNVELGG